MRKKRISVIVGLDVNILYFLNPTVVMFQRAAETTGGASASSDPPLQTAPRVVNVGKQTNIWSYRGAKSLYRVGF